MIFTVLHIICDDLRGGPKSKKARNFELKNSICRRCVVSLHHHRHVANRSSPPRQGGYGSFTFYIDRKEGGVFQKSMFVYREGGRGKSSSQNQAKPRLGNSAQELVICT